VSNKGLGEILLEADLISPSQLSEALGLQKAYGERLASVLVRKRMLTEKFAVTYLGRQLGYPGFDFSQAEIDLSLLSVVPIAVCERHRVFPVQLEAGQLQLAMSDPTNKALIAEVESRTKTRVTPLVALDSSIRHAIREARRAEDAGRRTITPNIQGAPKPPEPGATPPPRSEDAVAEQPLVRSADEKAPAAGAAEAQVAPAIMSLPTISLAASAAAAVVRTGSLKVLVAQTSDAERADVATALIDRKHRVTPAANGREALALVQECVFDLLILDATLPETDGLEVCRQLKQNERTKHLPVLLTVGAGLGWRFAADAKDRFGIDDVLEQPYDKAELLRRIDLLCDRMPSTPAAEDAVARRHLKEGVVALKRERYDEAVQALLRGLEADPFNDLLHYYLAMAYEKTGQVFRAIDHYEKAVHVNQDFYDAIISLANLYQRQQFRRKALEMWELALAATQEQSVRERIKEHILGLL
jgi:CheY-like chemotaxis protein